MGSLHPCPCLPPQVVRAHSSGLVAAGIVAYALENLHSKHKQHTFAGARPASPRQSAQAAQRPLPLGLAGCALLACLHHFGSTALKRTCPNPPHCSRHAEAGAPALCCLSCYLSGASWPQ